MKRSEVNAQVRWAKELLESAHFRLPDMAYWTMDEYRRHREDLRDVRTLMLGWDITDFGTDDYEKTGAVLYTVRNGSLVTPEIGVPYCEKLILMHPGQRLPCHYHVYKTEDIICRAFGPLEIRLWNTDESGKAMETPVQFVMDGMHRTVEAGEPFRITVGNSVTLTPGMAHIFGPAGGNPVVAGEVSRVNDDTTDNYFLEKTARFAEIEEDEEMLVPLCNEYDRV